MTVDERRRYALYEAARRELGEDEATALMELLPPVGWADVATKQDLAAFDHRFDAIDRRFDAMEQRFEAIDRRFEAIDRRFEAIDHRFEAIDRRFDAMEQRFEAIDHRFGGIDHRFVSIGHRLDGLETRLEAGLREQTNRLLMWIVPTIIASITASVSIAAAV